VKDIKFRDTDGCTLTFDSYEAITPRHRSADYFCVVLADDPERAGARAVGLTRAQALSLTTFLIEELTK
jgi:hypothetical protein